MTATKPSAELEDRAHREESEAQAAKALSYARARLVMKGDAASAFFATVALSLTPSPCWQIHTAATDGKRLLYHPEFFTALKPEEAIGVVVHEVLHVANRHMCRREQREPQRFNVACDLAIQQYVLDAGFKLPDCAIFPGRKPFKQLPAGLSAEAYYPLLPEDLSHLGGGDDPGGCGSVLDPGDGSPAALREAEAAANVTIAQAAHVARQRGTLPAGIARLVDAALQPKTDVAEMLRRFVTCHAKSDYCWARPNRRFVHAGLYLPSLHSEELGHVVAAFDTSGSISRAQMVRMGERLQGILETYAGCELTILFHDAEVAHVQHWTPQDGPLRLEPKGGGGTSHVPIFEYIEEHAIEPVCLVCLTDLFSSFPEHAPPYPVLWAITDNPTGKPPFGQALYLED